MRVFVYVSESRGFTALTVDESGANLPRELGPWHREAHALMPVSDPGTENGPDALEQALERQGYYLASPISMQDIPPGAELNDPAYGRADKLADTLVEHLTRESQGVLITVGALELATVRILNTLDQSGTVLEAYIADLRQIFSETQANAHAPLQVMRH